MLKYKWLKFWLVFTVVFFPLTVVVAADATGSEEPAPLEISSINQIIVIDRLIAERAYVNLKNGRPADDGIDFARLDRDMKKFRPELEKFDPACYQALWETYLRMKAYVTDPQSDFVRAIKKPGSVEFPGRSPLPAAFFADQASGVSNNQPAGQGIAERPSEYPPGKRP